MLSLEFGQFREKKCKIVNFSQNQLTLEEFHDLKHKQSVLLRKKRMEKSHEIFNFSGKERNLK